MLQAEREKMITMQNKTEACPVRVRFERKGSIVYIGHLDLMRTFERTLRRAGMPVQYTQGYNPRPTLVFALPLGVGIATTDDCVDIFFNEKIDIEEFPDRFNAYCPTGLRALAAWEIPDSGKSIMSLVTAATYRINAPGIRKALSELMTRDEIPVMKRAKGKETRADLRPLILKVTEPSETDKTDDGDLSDREETAEIMVYAGSSRNLRPDLLLSACADTGLIDKRAADNAEVLRTGLFTGANPDFKRLSDIRQFQ
ncbi:MAG: TIGR03936 family radical SAM-associated protein [Oscillospiraceae bacterium]|nr:TIGR03936 family radical SAM-associated protein [Oscillospiraceae bacterium]